jgi:hypothetical protein
MPARWNRKKIGFTVTLLALLLPNISFSSGFKTSNHGAKATAMGNAFTATSDNLSAIAYNPAGLTNSKGTNIYLGATAVISSITYENTLGISEDTEDQLFFPPHFYISSDFGMENLIVVFPTLLPSPVASFTGSPLSIALGTALLAIADDHFAIVSLLPD